MVHLHPRPDFLGGQSEWPTVCFWVNPLKNVAHLGVLNTPLGRDSVKLPQVGTPYYLSPEIIKDHARYPDEVRSCSVKQFPDLCVHSGGHGGTHSISTAKPTWKATQKMSHVLSGVALVLCARKLASPSYVGLSQNGHRDEGREEVSAQIRFGGNLVEQCSGGSGMSGAGQV